MDNRSIKPKYRRWSKMKSIFNTRASFQSSSISKAIWENKIGTKNNKVKD